VQKGGPSIARENRKQGERIGRIHLKTKQSLGRKSTLDLKKKGTVTLKTVRQPRNYLPAAHSTPTGIKRKSNAERGQEWPEITMGSGTSVPTPISRTFKETVLAWAACGPRPRAYPVTRAKGTEPHNDKRRPKNYENV